MEITLFDTPEAASAAAAQVIAQLLRDKPNAVLGLPTGSTPLPLYKELVRLYRAGQIDFSAATTFNLDEYIGLAPGHPHSFHSFMERNLFDHINIRKDRVFLPDGLAEDVPAFCAWYEAKIREAGGVDLQVLGIGLNGHIGFNEPGASACCRTRLVHLTEKTRGDNARFFESEDAVPKSAITMGLGNIHEARTSVLLAFGADKARIVAEALEGPVTEQNPGSLLQTHPSTRVFLDRQAARFLERQPAL